MQVSRASFCCDLLVRVSRTSVMGIRSNLLRRNVRLILVLLTYLVTVRTEYISLYKLTFTLLSSCVRQSPEAIDFLRSRVGEHVGYMWQRYVAYPCGIIRLRVGCIGLSPVGAVRSLCASIIGPDPCAIEESLATRDRRHAGRKWWLFPET